MQATAMFWDELPGRRCVVAIVRSSGAVRARAGGSVVVLAPLVVALAVVSAVEVPGAASTVRLLAVPVVVLKRSGEAARAVVLCATWLFVASSSRHVVSRLVVRRRLVVGVEAGRCMVVPGELVLPR